MEVAEDLREPESLMEAIRILRSQDPRLVAITAPSAEQIEDLNAVIKGLRLELDNGTDEKKGDETAFEFAVALLWHTDRTTIQEGVQLMEYLLKERWNLHWSSVTGDHGILEDALVESVPDEDAAEAGGSSSDEEWTDIAEKDSSCACKGCSPAWTTSRTNAQPKSAADDSAVLVGTAIRGATAPPPPEADDSSVPNSLTQGRTTSSASAAGLPPSSSTNTSTRGTDASSYTSPGIDSAVCAAADASTTSCGSAACMASTTPSRDEQLAKCYYHLGIGYTKLRKNDKAAFCVDNTLRLSPNNKDALLLKRLLSARLYVSHTVMRSLPLLALGFLFF